MPITKSAKKAIRAGARKRVFNLARQENLKEAIKALKLAPKDKKEIGKALADAYQAIDKAAKRGIIKKNTASRKKSQMAKIAKAKN
jgi:small subunit ribosomal protein S20